MSFLELRKVEKRFGPFAVLTGIDLKVEEHQVVCLIGPSGCGKSTLLRCINGLEPIHGGEIVLEGDRVSGPGVDVNKLRREVGIVFQSFNLFPHMSVLENVTLAPVKVLGRSRKDAEAAARALLDRIGLAEKAREYPDRLSGGQQQRVAIVRALAEVLNIVRDLASRGMTMLLATHEMGFAREVASKVCFLHGGVVYEEGPPDVLFGAPKQERTRAFLKRIIEAGRL
jgi:polar amino acid transport system ATP-binding protein